MARAVALVLFVVALFALGCRAERIPPLVEVTEIAPREADVGDRIELFGTGFPQGRAARVTFKGDLHRAGEPSTTGAEIDLDGAVTSEGRVEVVLGEAAVDAFCGSGGRAAHATFAGDVEVAFRSSAPGAPPLVGALRGVTLDVRPPEVAASVTEARLREGERVLAFLGITPGPATPRGLPIEAVAEGSPADRAGVGAGDLLTGVDGVHVASIDDVLPASARSTRIAVRRPGAPRDDVHTISLVGFAAARIPLEYAPALVVVVLALAVLLVLVAPGPSSIAALEIALASRLRGVRARALAAALVGRGARAVAAVLASVLVATFALGPYVLGPEIDGAALLVAALALFGAARVGAARGLAASLGAIGEVAAAGLLLAGAFAGAILSSGAVALAEIVRAQGGAPWEFAAARDPGAALVAGAWIATIFALVRPRRADGDAPLSVVLAPRPPGIMRVVERLALVFACALGVALFFGGWQLPGAAGSHAIAAHVVSAAIFVAKTWILAAAVVAAASLAPPVSTREARAFVLTRVAPALALGAGLVALARRFAPSRTLESAWGALVVTVLALVALRTVLRVRDAFRRPAPHASPFL